MFCRSAFGLCAALILLSAPVAHAQKLAITLYTGTTSTRRSDLHIVTPSQNTDLTIQDLGFRGRALQSSYYYGLRVGTYFHKHSPLGLDLELRHYKAYGRVEENRQVSGTFLGQPVSGTQPVNNFVQKYNITNGVSTVGLNLQYRWMLEKSKAFEEGRIQPYVGAGPTFYILWPFNLVNNQSGGGANYRGAGWGYNAFGGVRYGLAPRWNLLGEFGYSQGYKKHIDTADGGKSTVNLNTFHFNVGIQWAVL